MLDTLIAAVNPVYQSALLSLQGIPHETVGTLCKAQGFVDYNNLVDLNGVFSNSPKFGLVDRTQTITGPLKYHVSRPWAIPNQEFTLDQAAAARVQELEQFGSTINVLWSGGIDSTFIVTALLKHLKNRNQLRILYSPWSTYEHPEYLTFLKKFNDVELVDISGEVYFNIDQFDGIFVVGDGGDESHASLDESFIETHGWESLQTPWRDFFKAQGKSNQFIEFCENFFLLAGRPIDTVLEARWWFYIACKFHGTFSETKIPFFAEKKFSRLLQFFDTDHYQKFIYFNLDQIVTANDYTTWRQVLKDYCFEFDQLGLWRTAHKKISSQQLVYYSIKKMSLTDTRWLMILADGTRVFTPSLPLFSRLEFDKKYNSTLDYLFNHAQC
jgi:hypothetical protein